MSELTLLQKSQETFLEIQKRAESLVINSAETLQEAGEAVTIGKRIISVVDKHREEEKKPHFEAAKHVDEKHFAIIKPCKALVESIEAKSRAYRRQIEEEVEKQRKEAMRLQIEAERNAQDEIDRLETERLKIAQENEENNLPPPPEIEIPKTPVFIPPPPVVVPNAVTTSFGTMKLAKKYSFEIVDIAKVPAFYLTVDEKRVKEAINKQGKTEINGLRIYEI